MDNFTKISDIGVTDLQDWILQKVNEIADDLGQKLDENQFKYIPLRLYQFLSEKFKNWPLGNVESIFKAGVCGKYGKVTKITVSTLLFWLTTEEKSRRGENVEKFIFQDNTPENSEHFNRSATKCVPFINYCHSQNIDISELDYQQYSALRDRFNFDRKSAEIELEKFPKYRNFDFASRLTFRENATY